MKQLTVLWLTIFALLSPSTLAQEHAHSTLYTRVDGRDVRAAVELAIDRGWHAYHGPTRQEMGPEDAIGNPTALKMVGAGVKWGDVRYPKPKRLEQEYGLDDKPT